MSKAIPIQPKTAGVATSVSTVRNDTLPSAISNNNQDSITMNIVPCCAANCFILSMLCTWPNFCGIQSENTCCCCVNELIAIKPSEEPKVCLTCLKLDCEIVQFDVCLKSRSQLFCCDSRISFPPSDDVPCMCTLLFLTCCYRNEYQCNCCRKYVDLEDTWREKVRQTVR